MNPDASLCCKDCPSARPSQLPREVEHSQVALVLDWTTERESQRGWFAGKRGSGSDLLLTTLEALGVDDLSNLYVCSALNCRPNPKKQAQVKNAMLACRKRLVTELKEAGVKKVLCLGPVGYSALVSAKRTLPITKVRGRWVQAYGMEIMCTVAPGLVIAEPGFFRDFIFDLEKFFTFAIRKPTPDVSVWLPDTLAELDEAFDFIEQQEFHSCDLETDGFSPIDNNLTAAGFGVITDRETNEGVTVVLDETILSKKRTWKRIGKLLSSDLPTVFHNCKFDLKWLKRYLSRHEIAYKPHSVHDTMLLHYTLDERGGGGEEAGKSSNKFKCHNLEALARTRYDAPDYGIDMKKFLQEWHKASDYDRRSMRDKLHIYLGLDCYYTVRLFPDLWNEALREDEALIELYEDLLMPLALVLTDVEYEGVLLDHTMYEDMAQPLRSKSERLRKRICKVIDDPDFNPGSPKQVKKLLYEDLKLPTTLENFAEKGGSKRRQRSEAFKAAKGEFARATGVVEATEKSATSHDVLVALSQRFPEHKKLIDDILEYRTIKKMLGTYLDGLREKCDSDGKLRGNFNIHGTETGRISSSGPNLQNIPGSDHPSGLNIRSGFIAPKGYKFIEADYSQLEVRIAAELSGDSVMRAVFESGRDVHMETAQNMTQLPASEIDSYTRFLGKRVVFGLMYGRGAESIAFGGELQSLEKEWSIEEIQEYIDNLLNEWSVFAEWRDDQKHQGYQQGYVQLPTGRKRRFPFIPKHDGGFVARAAFNTPIQGTASDFTLYAVIELHKQLPDVAKVLLTVHDSILVMCPARMVTKVKHLMEHIMLNDTLFPTKVPLAVKLTVSDRWDEK